MVDAIPMCCRNEHDELNPYQFPTDLLCEQPGRDLVQPANEGRTIA